MCVDSIRGIVIVVIVLQEWTESFGKFFFFFKGIDSFGFTDCDIKDNVWQEWKKTMAVYSCKSCGNEKYILPKYPEGHFQHS